MKEKDRRKLIEEFKNLSLSLEFSDAAKKILEDEHSFWKDSAYEELVREKMYILLTGAWEFARVFDEMIANMLANKIKNCGVKRDPLILTDDYWWKNRGRYKKVPLITIGSQISNCVSAYIRERDGLTNEMTFGITKIGKRPVAYIWGPDVIGTYAAAKEFMSSDSYFDFLKHLNK